MLQPATPASLQSPVFAQAAQRIALPASMKTPAPSAQAEFSTELSVLIAAIVEKLPIQIKFASHAMLLAPLALT